MLSQCKLISLSGVIAAYIQLVKGSKYIAFSSFLDKWLKARKHLGLSALMLVYLHVSTTLYVGDDGAENTLYCKDLSSLLEYSRY